MMTAHGEKSCKDLLYRLSQLDFQDWAGIPSACTLADLAHSCDDDLAWRGQGWLGSDRRPADYLFLNPRDVDQSFRVWLAAEQIVLIDAETYDTPLPAADLRQTLGVPTAKLPSYLGPLRIEKSEWVYSSQGLALYINPETDHLLRWAVFQPTSLAQYQRQLRLNLQTRRLP